VDPNEIAGYMPKRRGFDVEFDNDAEMLLAELEFTEDDSPTDIQIKYKILDCYIARLDQRQKRKDFVISNGLINL